ncbi:redoxin family protein [uncultured Enterovirga sp.]|uniref:redoxin family protein n=1 Tax=uncultured Enterovirga sp. TaxID=2026352 RepID=UPI0035CA856B
MTKLFARRKVLVAAAGAALSGLAGCGRVEGSVLPDVVLPAISGLTGPNGWAVPGFASGEFRRGVALLNVWASWCPYCQAEHDHLLRLSRDSRFRLLGLVYRDSEAKAAAYLRRTGNPFAAVARDDGQLSRAVGQRGVPGTYVVARSGRVLTAVRGAIDERSIEGRLMPAIRRALAGDETIDS